MIRRLLVANRGEIACRIFRTARRLGIKCVAVHSAADENAEHVRQADESWYLGPAPAAESYLNMDRILQLAERSIDAIHPGYGFLSENPEFATRVIEAGITFVGPPPDAMRAVGDKRTARLRMKKISIPVVPGEEKVRTVAEFRTAARRIGYPVLVKAAAGGGGRGMRRVDTPDELSSALHAARHEAKAAFGDGRLLLEHCVESARHIEVQIFADSQGGIVHLFERDCSLQRRHQKIIEEAPAPGLDEDLTLQLREAALRVAREVGYVGAGTVEFLVPRDGPDPFYFLEMNARLQVEHTVTEEITGEDLVEWQLRVAAGETLPRTQEELAVTGHAIQARLCAEDPSDDFRPSPKPLRRLVLPEPGPGLRIDSGVVEGSAIPPDYDSLVAKIVASGPNRDAARARLYRALPLHPCDRTGDQPEHAAEPDPLAHVRHHRFEGKERGHRHRPDGPSVREVFFRGERARAPTAGSGRTARPSRQCCRATAAAGCDIGSAFPLCRLGWLGDVRIQGVPSCEDPTRLQILVGDPVDLL